MTRFAAALEAAAEGAGRRFVHGAETTADIILALDAGVTLERMARPGVMPNALLEDIVTRLTEPR